MGEVWLICDVDAEFEYLRPGYKNLGQGDPGLTLGVPFLLDFFKEYDIKATFHFQEQKDPNLSVLSKYPELYQMTKKYKQEISFHVHVREDNYETRKLEISTAFQRLKEHGYEVSSFIATKNWLRIPDSPYHPSYNDITKIGDAKILMIPLTNRRLGIIIHKDKEYEKRLMKKGVQTLFSVAQDIEQPVILYFTIHCWKLIELNRTSFRPWVIQRMKDFFDFLGKFNFKSLTVKEAGTLWEESGFKPYFLNLPELTSTDTPIPRCYMHRVGKYVGPKVSYIKYKLLGRL